MIRGMTEYTYRAEWSPETREYVGQCLEFPYLWWRGLTPEEAIAGVARMATEEVASILAAEGTPPESLTDRRYSGKFMVRASPVLHARLAVEAAEQGVSPSRRVAALETHDTWKCVITGGIRKIDTAGDSGLRRAPEDFPVLL
jgi:predicted RNase H-like HicB family nuclease